MSPKEAIDIVKQLPQFVSGTPAAHKQITFAISVLESLAISQESKNKAAKPAKKRR